MITTRRASCRHLFDLNFGTDNLFRTEHTHVTARDPR